MSLNCQADELTEQAEGEEQRRRHNKHADGPTSTAASKERERGGEGGRLEERGRDNGGQIMSIFAFLK